MDKEKLDKAIIIRSMLDTDLNALSRALDIKDGVLGDKNKLRGLIEETQKRLQKEFDEL